MRSLSLVEVLDLHRQVIEQSGGAQGLLDLCALESALAQPHMTFDGEELYPSIVEKAAAEPIMPRRMSEGLAFFQAFQRLTTVPWGGT
jgi:prophage maintenance system killer protein